MLGILHLALSAATVAVSEMSIVALPSGLPCQFGLAVGWYECSTRKGRIQLWTDRKGIGPKYRESKLRGLKELTTHSSPFCTRYVPAGKG
jgi:hypothetical protein